MLQEDRIDSNLHEIPKTQAMKKAYPRNTGSAVIKPIKMSLLDLVIVSGMMLIESLNLRYLRRE